MLSIRLQTKKENEFFFSSSFGSVYSKKFVKFNRYQRLEEKEKDSRHAESDYDSNLFDDCISLLFFVDIDISLCLLDKISTVGCAQQF